MLVIELTITRLISLCHIDIDVNDVFIKIKNIDHIQDCLWYLILQFVVDILWVVKITLQITTNHCLQKVCFLP